MIRLVLGQADSVTGGSDYQLELCRSAGASRSRLAWAPLGVDVEQFTPARPPTSPPFWIVQAASLTPVKGQALLLELLAQVRREADVRLLLVGDGPALTQLLVQADSLQIGDAVTWSGRVPYPQMPDYLRRAHVYVQSSWHEAQGMAPLEALACGLPVLGTPVGILPEVAARPATTSVAELSEQVLELAQNRSVYLEARSAARRRAEDDFSWETSLARFNKLYESVR
jgi:glycosyltransferase involved in cell wall biosynthesis